MVQDFLKSASEGLDVLPVKIPILSIRKQTPIRYPLKALVFDLRGERETSLPS